MGLRVRAGVRLPDVEIGSINGESARTVRLIWQRPTDAKMLNSHCGLSSRKSWVVSRTAPTIGHAAASQP